MIILGMPTYVCLTNGSRIDALRDAGSNFVHACRPEGAPDNWDPRDYPESMHSKAVRVYTDGQLKDAQRRVRKGEPPKHYKALLS